MLISSGLLVYVQSLKARNVISRGLVTARHVFAEQVMLESIAREAAYAALRAGNISQFSVDVGSRLDQIDEDSFALASGLGSLPTPSFWPNALDSVGRLDLSNYDGRYSHLRLLSTGSIAELGTETVTFTTDSYTCDVDLSFFSIPLANYCIIAYGQPSSDPIAMNGRIQTGVEAMVLNARINGNAIIVTEGNPANDPTVADHLFTATSPETLSYFDREEVMIAWDAMEYLWRDHQSHLVSDAGANVVQFGSSVSVVAGVTLTAPVGARQTITIDLDAVDSSLSTLVVTDYVDLTTNKRLVISGSGSGVGGNLLNIVVRNVGVVNRTEVRLEDSNSRPIALYGARVEYDANSSNALTGMLALDPDSSFVGDILVNGMFAYDANMSGDFSSSAIFPASSAVYSELVDALPRATIITSKSRLR